MSYDFTIQALKDKYGEEFNTSILCLLDNYYPLIAKNIMQELSINDDKLRKCAVIYNDLGISNSSKNDYSNNTDNSLELSPIFLRKFIDNLIFTYNKIENENKRKEFIYKTIKPLLISGSYSSNSNTNDKDEEMSIEDITKNETSLKLVLGKIYESGRANKLKTISLSSKEIKLIELVYSVMFGESDSFYMDKLLEEIFNELINEGSFDTQMFGIKDKEELITEFISKLNSKINSSRGGMSKKDIEYARRQSSRNIPKKVLQQSYKKEREHYFKLHPELKKSKESKMNLKNYLQKKLTISPKESELIESVFKDYVLKSKKTAMKEFNAFLIPLKDFISKYSDEIKPSEGIDSFFEKMDEKYPKFNLLQMYSSLKSKNKFDYDLLKKHYSSFTEKKESTLKLKDYLHKKLTISEKEASFIELAVKEYVQKKKQVKETFPKRKLRNPDYDYDMSSLENDESMEYRSSYSNDPLADEKPAIPYPEDEEEDFYSRPEFAKNPNFRRPSRTQKR